MVVENWALRWKISELLNDNHPNMVRRTAPTGRCSQRCTSILFTILSVSPDPTGIRTRGTLRESQGFYHSNKITLERNCELSLWELLFTTLHTTPKFLVWGRMGRESFRNTCHLHLTFDLLWCAFTGSWKKLLRSVKLQARVLIFLGLIKK